MLAACGGEPTPGEQALETVWSQASQQDRDNICRMWVEESPLTHDEMIDAMREASHEQIDSETTINFFNDKC